MQIYYKLNFSLSTISKLFAKQDDLFSYVLLSKTILSNTAQPWVLVLIIMSLITNHVRSKILDLLEVFCNNSAQLQTILRRFAKCMHLASSVLGVKVTLKGHIWHHRVRRVQVKVTLWRSNDYNFATPYLLNHLKYFKITPQKFHNTEIMYRAHGTTILSVRHKLCSVPQ